MIWGINSFEQRGAALGKLLASSILPEIGASGRGIMVPCMTMAWLQQWTR
jgi:hypothetical protein